MKSPVTAKKGSPGAFSPKDKLVSSSRSVDSKMAQLGKLAKSKMAWAGDAKGKVVNALTSVKAGGVLGFAMGAAFGAYGCAVGGPVASLGGAILGGIVGGGSGLITAYLVKYS